MSRAEKIILLSYFFLINQMILLCVHFQIHEINLNFNNFLIFLKKSIKCIKPELHIYSGNLMFLFEKQWYKISPITKIKRVVKNYAHLSRS